MALVGRLIPSGEPILQLEIVLLSFPPVAVENAVEKNIVPPLVVVPIVEDP